MALKASIAFAVSCELQLKSMVACNFFYRGHV